MILVIRFVVAKPRKIFWANTQLMDEPMRQTMDYAVPTRLLSCPKRI